jgi:hypothetical protein
MSKPKRIVGSGDWRLEYEGEDVQAPFPEDTLASVSHVEETQPDATLSGGDVDAVRTETDAGEETVGGSTPTPDQDVVDELGKAVGVTYEDGEPLRFGDKVADRDAQRWELNPASSEEYQERLRELSGAGERAAQQPAPINRSPRAGATSRGKQTASRAKRAKKETKTKY